MLAISFFLPNTAFPQTPLPIYPSNASALERRDNDIVFRRFNTEQGLSQSNVYGIVQDYIGFIWIATADGLNRFDGTSFKVYKRVPSDKTSLSDNFTTCLLEDRSGTLWIGTRDGGLNKFDRKNGTFTAFKHNPQDNNSLASNHVKTLFQDSKGIIWVGTENGINRFNPQSGINTTFRHTSTEGKSLGANVIKTITEDKAGNIWVGTEDGIEIIRAETGECLLKEPYQRYLAGMRSHDVNAILADVDGIMWLGTETTGLYKVHPTERKVLRHFPGGTLVNDAAKGMQDGRLPSNDVIAMRLDSKQRLWICTGGGGLVLYNRVTETFSHYSYDPSNGRSLSGNIVFAFCEDRSGAYWVGTFGNGLNVFHGQANVFQTTVCFPQNPNDLLSNAVYALLEDRTQTLWIGTEEGLLRMNPLTRRVERVPPPDALREKIRDKSVSGFVRHIMEARDGTIWLATDAGLQRMNSKTTERTVFAGTVKTPDSALTRAFRALDVRLIDQTFVTLESRDSLIWVGTRGGGLKVFNPHTKTYIAHYVKQQGAPSLGHNFVRALKEDSKGRIWIGTRGGGLSRFNPRTGEWKTYRHDDANPNSLSHDGIFSLHFSGDSVLWIGTQGGGICRMDVRTEQFIAWKEEHGLANNVVYAVLEDMQGDLWMSTHQGLSRMTPPSAENIVRKPLTTDVAKAYTPFRNYDVNDGLQNNEFNAGAYSQGASGRLYFGGLQGFSTFFPDSVRVNSFIPPIVLTALRRFGEEVPLEEDISLLDTLTVSYKDNVFSLEFSALSFVQSDENRFKYMLEGFDAKWISAGKRHEARYTNLSGGTYIFRVKACNNDGIWNEVGKRLVVQVIPPFWERWWFRVLVACGIGFIGVIAYRARVRIIERRANELERQVEERTAELRESNDRLHNANEEIQRQIALLDEQTREIEVANATLQEKNLELEDERHTSERLILNVLPPSIASRLRAGEERIADGFDAVTVMFADIVGFTELAAKQSPHEVVDVLNTVFSAFDIFSERYGLEKIKTIGDAYMIVGGVPEPKEDHASAIAGMAIEMLQTLEILRYTMKIPLEVRIGIHTGPVVAGIIGQKKFSYDLWGDTVNTASRMESHGETGKIHCSREVYLALKEEYDFEPPRMIDVKGKGTMETYFLVGKRK
ncbi:MAG: hypothetical protein MUF71_02610 [Candidatus Kapabacteria bacterium]|nr:hypothetical protein [Candidatus Kapabacteria bacterium]